MKNAPGSFEDPIQVYDGILRGLFAHMADHYREQLRRMLSEKSLGFGHVVLSSGQSSNYYVDCKLTTLDPEGSLLTGYAVLEALEEMKVAPDAIGGMSMGADPIVSATVAASYLRSREHPGKKPIQGFLIRKERKEHGKEKQIEGFDVKGHRVVIIDEVCTSGKSILDAVAAVTREGGQIVGILSLVDREEGGSEKLHAKYNYHSVFKACELLAEREKLTEATRRAS